MQHVVQQLENRSNKITIDNVLGHLKVCSIRIKQRDEQFLEATKTLISFLFVFI